MKSIKPGRGPSMMGGVASIVFIIVGIGWTAIAARFGGFMVLFGIAFIVIAVVNGVYHLKNAMGQNRYSAFDITDEGEEPDPLNQRFGATRWEQSGQTGGFCPYCGAKAGEDHVFCRSCGKKLN